VAETAKLVAQIHDFFFLEEVEVFVADFAQL
jgi:hypothetical protein